MATQTFPMQDPDRAAENVRENLRLLLGIKNVQAQELADALGVTPATVSRRLAGLREFKSREIARAAFFLGVRLERLYDDPSTHREHALSSFTWVAHDRRTERPLRVA